MKSATITVDEFRADPGAAFRLAQRASCVIVKESDGTTACIISIQHRALHTTCDKRERKRGVTNNRRT